MSVVFRPSASFADRQRAQHNLAITYTPLIMTHTQSSLTSQVCVTTFVVTPIVVTQLFYDPVSCMNEINVHQHQHQMPPFDFHHIHHPFQVVRDGREIVVASIWRDGLDTVLYTVIDIIKTQVVPQCLVCINDNHTRGMIIANCCIWIRYVSNAGSCHDHLCLFNLFPVVHQEQPTTHSMMICQNKIAHHHLLTGCRGADTRLTPPLPPQTRWIP